MELRDGQHIGVETKEFGKKAPPSLRIALVLGMYSREPSSTSWSSVKIRIILGFLGVGCADDAPPFRDPE